MSEAYLSLEAKEQGEILRVGADRSGRPPAILEKDIWLCWVLQVIFSIPDHHPMAFKGGTSRHWYDLVCLSQHNISRKASCDRTILKSVIQHKKVFYNASQLCTL